MVSWSETEAGLRPRLRQDAIAFLLRTVLLSQHHLLSRISRCILVMHITSKEHLRIPCLADFVFIPCTLVTAIFEVCRA